MSFFGSVFVNSLRYFVICDIQRDNIVQPMVKMKIETDFSCWWIEMKFSRSPCGEQLSALYSFHSTFLNYQYFDDVLEIWTIMDRRELDENLLKDLLDAGSSSPPFLTPIEWFLT